VRADWAISGYGGWMRPGCRFDALLEPGRRLEADSSAVPVCDTARFASHPRGPAARASGLALGMTRQYVAGELSVLLAHLQTVTTTEAAGHAAWSLRHAAETEPIPALGSVTVRALALTEGLCWESLNRGDIAAFSRQAAVGAELHEFGVCAGLLEEA
jgi:hypothetical protein